MATITSCRTIPVNEVNPQRREEQFLILAPTGRDAALTSNLLADASLQATVCADVNEVCRRVAEEGAMALLVAEEALSMRGFTTLRELLASQPAWSDLPILLFTGRLTTPTKPLSAQSIEALGNVTLLERPLRPVTMLSAANAAQRARKRQYMARDELKAQKDQVRQRDQFLAMLGHELRNPLSAITMAIELEGDAAAAAQYKAVVTRQARHLTRLVDDLLDVARVTSGKIVLQRATVDLTELLHRTLLGMSATLAKNELTFRSDIPDCQLLVEADSVRLEQILVNLLNNAIKYTPARGHIEVRVIASAQEVEICVCDDGVGIAPDMLPRVFELFAQAEGTLDRSKGGMGIGLTLVQSLVRLHGGSVDAESSGLGHGSTFRVHLPRKGRSAPSGAGAESGAARVPLPREKAPRACGALREILIVEDNDDSRELLTAMLKRRGHKVLAAADGPAGVRLALQKQPEALLVDIGLPGLDGYAVARELRPRLARDVLMIAVTGYGQPDDKQRALEAGFDAHLTKPIDLARLEHLLSRELGRVPSQPSK
jgi:signal transduction histidine kinase/ActR/RegA family two-component response regulator